MVRLAFRDRRLKIAGIGGTLRKSSVSFGGLIVEFVEKLRSEEPVGALV
jgi:hypothetical protein